MDDRKAFAAIVYVLRTGLQWNALPRELGASSTVHDRFQEWEQKGFFKVLWQAGLMEYDEVQGIEWEWQSVDGAMTKAPFGCASTGANPTDRGKLGVKRSLLTDPRDAQRGRRDVEWCPRSSRQAEQEVVTR
jgi:putative transposase